MSGDSVLDRVGKSSFVLTLVAVVGVVLALAAGGGLFYAEDNAIKTATRQEQSAGEARTVAAGQPDPANDGKLVHVTGEAAATEDLADPDVGLSAGKVLRLAREVEVFQWKEDKSESKKDKAKTVTYKYTQVWSKEKPPQKFAEAAGHKNPDRKPYEDAAFSAAGVKLGGFTPARVLVDKLKADEPLAVTAEMLAKVPDDLKDRVKPTPDGMLFVAAAPGSTPEAPQIGDARIRYKAAKPQTVTVVAKQSGSTLEPSVSPDGVAIGELLPGTHSAQSVIAAAASASQLRDWAMRAGALVLIAVGLFLVFRRQVAVASGAPPEGTAANVGLGVFAVLFALCLGAVVSGGRWVMHQPALGGGLLAGGLVVLVGLFLVSRRFKPGLTGGAKKWTEEEREQFRRIALDPDNKERRLVLAAALEKKGDPLGEFIRLDHEVEALPEGDARREEPSARWNDLLTAHGGTWYATLRKLRLEPKVMEYFAPIIWMHHGIIDQVLIDLPGILPEKAAQLFEGVPGLRVLEFHNVRVEQGVVGWKDSTYTPDVPAIVGVPQLKQIGVLRMSSLQLTTADLEAIASSPNLENLTELDFGYNKVGPEGAVALAQSTTLKRLRVLELRGCEVGEEGAVALAKSANLANLVGLNLGANAIGTEGAKALAASPHLKNLQSLALDDNTIATAGAQAVAASPNFRKLTALDLGRNEIGPEGALALAKSPNLANLETLKLNDAKLGGMGLRYLASSPHPTKLKVLELDSNEIDDPGPRTLVASPAIKLLEELSLSYNQIGDPGVMALAAWAGAVRLKKLKLRQNKFGAAAVKALAESPHLRGLKELDLSNNNTGLAGARLLAASPVLKDLEYLWIQEANLTAEGEELLRKRYENKVFLT